MDSKNWSLLFIKLFVSVMFVIGCTVVIVDPFFHYHAPIEGLSYYFEDEAYFNDGISKNFEYQAIITGTSMTKGFKIKEAEQLFDKQFVRLTFMGEGFKRINDNLETAIKENPKLDFVIRGVDTEWFLTSESWLGYDEYPEYLYDNYLLNDTSYLFNKDILMEEVIPEIVRSLKDEPADSLDNYGYGQYGDKKKVLAVYERPSRENKEIDVAETEEYYQMIENNLNKNVISVIKNNPDITFYLFFPPHSICWWDGLNQHGEETLKRRIAFEDLAIDLILECENVSLFSFNNNFELVCNLDNYVDTKHYVETVNSEILKFMSEGKYQITKDNKEDYIREISEFYCNYNYDAIFE